MLDWIKSWFKRKPSEKDLFGNLPDFCRYDPISQVVTIDYRGTKAYFTRSMVLSFTEAKIDYIAEYTASVDEFFAEKEQEEE